MLHGGTNIVTCVCKFATCPCKKLAYTCCIHTYCGSTLAMVPKVLVRVTKCTLGSMLSSKGNKVLMLSFQGNKYAD